MFDDLAMVPENNFNATHRMSDIEYRNRLQKHWNVLCLDLRPDLLHHLPKQNQNVGSHHIMSRKVKLRSSSDVSGNPSKKVTIKLSSLSPRGLQT
jgi:hypothetical protein